MCTAQVGKHGHVVQAKGQLLFNKTTWHRQRSKHWHQLDNVLMHIQDVHSTHVMRSKECWTDHRLVRSKLSISIQTPKRTLRVTTIKKLDVQSLKDPAVNANFNKATNVALERMSCLTKPDDNAYQK